MRTRLDEIVEEELPVARPLVGSIREICMRIAERSFRHGVEEAFRDAKRYGINAFNFTRSETVQPAPAEETPYWIKFDGSLATRMDDRRYGQRRKGIEHRGTYESTYGYWWIYRTIEGLNWHNDRRSGKDRRKS